MALYRKNYNTLLSTSKMIRSSEFDIEDDGDYCSEPESEEEDSASEENSNMKRVKLNPESTQEKNLYDDSVKKNAP